VQDLTRPKVMITALTAALGTSIACYPRLAMWSQRPQALWVLVCVLFASAWVIWGFALAWHEKYTGRPMAPRPLNPRLWALAMLAAAIIGAVFHFVFDPLIRAHAPGDLPGSLEEWAAMTLFAMAFQQLFLVFGPLAFFARILGNGRAAVYLTLFFGGVVIAAKAQPLTAQLPWYGGAGFLAFRMLAGLLTIFFYMRGGIPLAYGWTLALQLRLLPGLA